MRLITERDGGLSAYFDIIDENEAASNNSSLKQLPINKNTAADWGIIRRHLPLEFFLGFVKQLRK